MTANLFRKGIFSGLAMLLVITLAQAQSDPIKDFIPAGYRLLLQEKGDLNKDGEADVVLVVENTDPTNIRINKEGMDADTLNLNDRMLLVLFGSGANTFRKVAENRSFLPSEHDEESSCLADPLLQDGGISIDKSRLKIDLNYWYSCGSWYVSQHTYTLRWQENRMRLIGFDSRDFHRASGEISRSSINLLTGQRKDVTGENEFEDSGKVKTTLRPVKPRKPLFLEDLTEDSGEMLVKY
ncbi:MAG: hypothetical protein EOP52_13295 [Sphingobacteriales bacterium]|nr:MAG: hypothetical protein EOP52_13295 [Sphingobacteriales bacterium]